MKTKTKEELDAQKEQLDSLRSEILELDAKEELTDDESERLDAAIPEYETLRAEYDADLERAEKVAEIERSEHSGFTGNGDGARVAPVPGATERNIWDIDEVRRSVSSRAEFDAELVSRAATAIEQCDAIDGMSSGGATYRSDEVKEQMTQLLERGLGPANGDPHGSAVAEHWLTFGSPEYKENWQRALRGDLVAMSYCQQETQRAAWAEGTTTTGGFAVVPDYDLTLLLINAGTVNPFRQISRVVQTNSNQWKGLSTAGVTAEWMTESTEASDATPTIAQPAINVYREDAYLQASFEVVADSNLGSEVGMLIGDAFDRLESAAFAVGTGGGQPYGVMTRVALITASRVAGSSGAAGAADLVQADIYAVDNALAPRYRPNASWVANKTTYNAIRKAGSVAANNNTFWVDFGGGVPAKLIGYPTYESAEMDSTIVSGSNDDVLVLGDFRQGYIIVDRIGMTMAYNPLVLGSNRRPTGEVGWFAYKRVGADVVDQTNLLHFKALRV